MPRASGTHFGRKSHVSELNDGGRAKYLRHRPWFSLSTLRLTSSVSCLRPARVRQRGVGLSTGVSTLSLLADVETLFRDHLCQPLSDLPRSEERNTSRFEPPLRDLDRLFATSSRGSQHFQVEADSALFGQVNRSRVSKLVRPRSRWFSTLESRNRGVGRRCLKPDGLSRGIMYP